MLIQNVKVKNQVTRKIQGLNVFDFKQNSSLVIVVIVHICVVLVYVSIKCCFLLVI